MHVFVNPDFWTGVLYGAIVIVALAVAFALRGDGQEAPMGEKAQREVGEAFSQVLGPHEEESERPVDVIDGEWEEVGNDGD